MIGLIIFLLAIAEVAAMLAVLTVKIIASKLKEGTMIRIGRPSESIKGGKERTITLSEKQKEQIVNSILESSLLINDSVYDSLVYKGEALYPASEACGCGGHDFDLQYGSEDWLPVWSRTISNYFDCQSEYKESGIFRCFGKEV